MNSDYEFQITDEQGLLLVKMARMALEKYQSEGIYITVEADQDLGHRFGVFVTLYYVDRSNKFELRGCIGYPLPNDSLVRSLVNASVKAANEDPRFSPVSYNELREILIEVSILSPPMLISAENIKSKILIGKHGLIIEGSFGSGLLLPNVASENGWDTIQFLEQLCHKGGLPSNAWMYPNIRLYSFESLIFRETKPGGQIVRMKKTL